MMSFGIKIKCLLFLLVFISLNYKHVILDVGFNLKLAHLFVPVALVYFKPYRELIRLGALWVFPIILSSIVYEMFFISGEGGGLNDYFKWIFWYLVFIAGFILTKVIGENYFERTFTASIFILLTAVVIKNLFYIDQILYMYLAGGAHPRSDWNFYNVGYNINNEVTWIVLLTLILGMKAPQRYGGIAAFLNAMISKVNGALILYPLWFFLISMNRIPLWVRYTFILLAMSLVVWISMSTTYDDIVDLGSGRIGLWDYWVYKVASFNLFEHVWGVNLGAMYNDPFLHDNLVADFHNVYLDLQYEQGLWGLFMFIYLVLFPILKTTVLSKGAIDYLSLDNRIAVVLIICCINGLVSFRPLDPIFPFLFGIWASLQSEKNNKAQL